MKKFLLGCLVLLFQGVSLSAQDAEVRNDLAPDSILKELQIIRGIQQESYNQRMLAIAERQRRDSALERVDGKNLSSDYGMMAQIEDNTRQDPIKDNWNLYGWIAFFLALTSVVLAGYTFYYQQRTEGNTKKLSQDMQRDLLYDLLRHLYRNYVITYAMKSKMEDIDYKGYPSEEHYVKLKIPMENIHLDAFYGEDEKYQKMHNLYLNLRNYNEEVDVALKHATDRNLDRTIKDEDFGTLEFKEGFYLTERIINTIYEVWGQNTEYTEDMRKVLKSAFEKSTDAKGNIDVKESNDFKHVDVEKFKATAYNVLFPNETDELCKQFNAAVREERKKNKRGVWKIRIIKF